MTLFTSIGIELYIEGAWSDISADVLAQPAPRWNVGIMDDGPTDRTGDPEIFTFSLNNSVTCSGGVAGYYSPGHASMRTGWKTGLPVRLYFVYDGGTYYKYYGRISQDGIEATPGTKGPRRVDVSCHGFMGECEKHTLDLIAVQENKTIEEAVQIIIDNMPFPPTAVQYGTGVSTFLSVFDTATPDTKAIAELQKLAMSELGYIYTKDGGTLVVKGRDDFYNLSNSVVSKGAASYLLLETGDYFLLENGSKLILDETQAVTFTNDFLDGMDVAYGKHYYNRVKSTAYPRRIDAAATTVLWSLETAIEIPAGETKSGIRGTYRNPTGGSKTTKGMAMVTPVSGTDFVANAAANGSGASKTANMSVTATFGAAEAEFSITNSDTSSIYTGGDAGTFQCRGKGIYFDDNAVSVVKDDAEINDYGMKELSIDMKYQNDPTVTEAYADWQLTRRKVHRTSVDKLPLAANRSELNMYAFLQLEPGDRIAVAETQTGLTGDYFIMGYEAEIIGKKHVIWYPVLQNAEEMDFYIYEQSYKRKTELFTAATEADLVFNNNSAINGGTGDGSLAKDSVYGWTILGYSDLTGAGSDSGSGYELKITDDYKVSNGAVEYVLHFNIPNFVTTYAYINAMIGMIDDSTPTNGIYLNFASSGGVTCKLTGKTTNTSTTSTTGTEYVISAQTNYKARITVNDAGTLVSYYLYDDDDVLLWSNTLATNIPASSTSLYPVIRVTFSVAALYFTGIFRPTYFTMGWISE